jgi:hypothetical protein
MRIGVLPALQLNAVLAAGCSNMNIQQHYVDMRPAMIRGDWKTAVAEMERAKEDGIYDEEDRVMYWLNYGTVLHHAGEHQKSQAELVHAEEAMQELWTKSISAEASKFLVNETLQPYPGEDFEKILLYLYTSLNNVKTGQLQQAIVEARRADEFLKKMRVYYEQEGGIGTAYKQDAFMLWMVGLYYEIEGTLAQAALAYKAAYDAFESDYRGNFGAGPPSFVAEDVVRTAQVSGNAPLADQLRAKGASGATIDKVSQGMAEIILIHGSGEAPRKLEYKIDHRMPDGYVARIALPKFEAQSNRIEYAQMEIEGTSVRTELMEPVTTIALKNFKTQQAGLTARAIARAVLKYGATKGTQKAVEGGGGDANRKLAGAAVGLLGNIASAATEAADLRSWTMLPSEIDVARVLVPPGNHLVNVTFHGSGGQTIGQPLSMPIELKNGERRIVSVRTFE